LGGGGVLNVLNIRDQKYEGERIRSIGTELIMLIKRMCLDGHK